MTHLIEACIITGASIGTQVIIPRIKFVHSGDDIPFVFTRKQFPLRVCYAMTINKSQGQSLQKVGVYLPHPVFGHGQLYVALSRATSVDAIRLLLLDAHGRPSNSTVNVVFKDLLASVDHLQVFSSLFFLFFHFLHVYCLVFFFMVKLFFIVSYNCLNIFSYIFFYLIVTF